MDEEEARRRRAEARRSTVTMRWVRPGERVSQLGPYGAEAVAQVTRLTRTAWCLSGREWPESPPRAEWRYTFVTERLE